MIELPVFIDIHGTLTATQGGGKVLEARIRAVQAKIADGTPVVIWSGAGTEFAKKFCREHNLRPIVAIGKPSLCIDDQNKIRWGGVPVKSPEIFFGPYEQV